MNQSIQESIIRLVLHHSTTVLMASRKEYRYHLRQLLWANMYMLQQKVSGARKPMPWRCLTKLCSSGHSTITVNVKVQDTYFVEMSNDVICLHVYKLHAGRGHVTSFTFFKTLLSRPVINMKKSQSCIIGTESIRESVSKISKPAKCHASTVQDFPMNRLAWATATVPAKVKIGREIGTPLVVAQPHLGPCCWMNTSI